jgi:hypothetical protein
LRNEQPESELAGGVQIDAAAISINAHHSSQQFLFFKNAICSRMCVTLGQELSGFERALFFHDAVHEEMVLTAKKDDVPAPHVFDGGPPNQRDILRPQPRKHARTLSAERDPAAVLQGVCDSRGVAGAAFTAYSLRLFASVGSRLHPFLNSERFPMAQKALLIQ